jgi:hypothetical protein
MIASKVLACYRTFSNPFGKGFGELICTEIVSFVTQMRKGPREPDTPGQRPELAPLGIFIPKIMVLGPDVL